MTQKLFRKTAEFGSITLLKNNEAVQEEKEIEKYVIKKVEVSEAIEIYKKNLEELKIKRKETQKHIALSQLPENEQFSSLANEKKHIMDNIKMIAYRAETAMANIIKPIMQNRILHVRTSEIRPPKTFDYSCKKN